MALSDLFDRWTPIVTAVAEETGVSIHLMRGLNRNRRVSFARRKAIQAILDADGTATHEEIGRYFRRDRSTISYLLRSATA